MLQHVSSTVALDGKFVLFFLIIFYWLRYYSCLNFSPFALLHPAPPSPSGTPHTIVHVQASCIGSSATPFPVLYFTSPHYSVTTYLYFLIPSPRRFPSHHPPIWHPSKLSLCPWFCLCTSCLLSLFSFFFLDSPEPSTSPFKFLKNTHTRTCTHNIHFCLSHPGFFVYVFSACDG